MVRSIGALIFICSILLVVFSSPQYRFYSKSRVDRLESLWSADIKNLLQKNSFADFTRNIKNVELIFNDPQVAAELDELKTPFSENSSGSLILRIEVIRWIDNYEYGYVLQHNFFDSENSIPAAGAEENEFLEEKIYEFGRTYKVGIFW